MQSDGQKWYLTSHQNVTKIIRKSKILIPKGSKNQLKWCTGELRKLSWKQVGSGTPKKCQRQVRGTPFWVPFGWSWAPFWAPLAAKGLPKSKVLAPGCSKISKHDIQNEASEKVWNLNWNLFGKCESLNVLHPPKCFICKHFGGFSTLPRNPTFHWKLLPKWCPKCFKIEPGGHLGLNF